jgi:hypothetical protein
MTISFSEAAFSPLLKLLRQNVSLFRSLHKPHCSLAIGSEFTHAVARAFARPSRSVRAGAGISGTVRIYHAISDFKLVPDV